MTEYTYGNESNVQSKQLKCLLSEVKVKELLRP